GATRSIPERCPGSPGRRSCRTPPGGPAGSSPERGPDGRILPAPGPGENASDPRPPRFGTPRLVPVRPGREPTASRRTPRSRPGTIPSPSSRAPQGTPRRTGPGPPPLSRENPTEPTPPGETGTVALKLGRQPRTRSA